MADKQWYKRRNERNLKRRTKKKKAKKLKITRQHRYNYEQKEISRKQNANNFIADGEIKIPFKIPSKFTLTESEETTSFFNSILDYIGNKYNSNNHKIKNRLIFDMSSVEFLTNDALMYLLAIIKNVKVKYNSAGNLPKNKECKKLVIDSGFLNYVNTNKNIEMSQSTNKIQIQLGNTIDIAVAKKICDFMITNCSVLKRKCKFLYDILIELMTNTFQHAYNNNMLLSFWYVFVEREENIVKFTFLDTGEGIPQTIRKRKLEKIKLLGIKTDSQFIKSALDGEFRTRTSQNYRGKGLPKILKYNLEDKIQNLKILSRYGVFAFNTNNDMILKEKVQGTLFSWEININNMKEDI